MEADRAGKIELENIGDGLVFAAAALPEHHDTGRHQPASGAHLPVLQQHHG